MVIKNNQKLILLLVYLEILTRFLFFSKTIGLISWMMVTINVFWSANLLFTTLVDAMKIWWAEFAKNLIFIVFLVIQILFADWVPQLFNEIFEPLFPYISSLKIEKVKKCFWYQLFWSSNSSSAETWLRFHHQRLLRQLFSVRNYFFVVICGFGRCMQKCKTWESKKASKHLLVIFFQQTGFCSSTTGEILSNRFSSAEENYCCCLQLS